MTNQTRIKKHHRRTQANTANVTNPQPLCETPRPPRLRVKTSPAPTPNSAPPPAPAPTTPAPTAPTISAAHAAHLTACPATFFRAHLAHHCRHDFNQMHHFSFQQYDRQSQQLLPHRKGRRLAIAAPRGAAKSTIHTMLFPLMDLLSGRERHQVIISGTMQQAKGRIATIARELRTNVAIRDAFFGGRMPRFKSNSRSIEMGNCLIEAFSAGSEMRGISHGEFRPTRIILDDVEQSRNSSKSYHRKKLLNWYDEIVENLGDTYTHITIVGTILHTDSLLSTLLNRPGYKAQLYKSIVKWNPNEPMWQHWQRLYTDRTDPDAADTAQAYFDQNETAMLEDTEVFWPTKEPYILLQEKYLTLGRAAFFKEKQNSPIKDGDQIFDTSLFTRFISPNSIIQTVTKGLTLDDDQDSVGQTFLSVSETPKSSQTDKNVRPTHPTLPSSVGEAHPTIHNSKFITHNSQPTRLEDLKYFGFLDPAMGKPTTRDGDYAAIVTVGLALDGTLYVMDVWMERASPLRQVQQIMANHDVYNYQQFGFESNGFQETIGTFIRDEQKNRQQSGRPWRLPITKHVNTHSKHSRISLLEPHILAGSIHFQQNLKQEFYIQADEYNGRPTNHDDGLDALASCIEMIRKSQRPAATHQIKSISKRTFGRSPL